MKPLWKSSALLLLAASVAISGTRTETHPCLLIGPGDIAGLAEKLGSTHLGSDVFSEALEACVRGERSNDAVSWLMAWVTHVEATGIYSDTGTFRWNPNYAHVCDLQWNAMTVDERSRSRTVLMNMSAAAYTDASTGGAWFYQTEHINNWAISHMTDYYIQRMLFPALMFPDDARSATSVTQAIDILRHWWDRCPGAITGGTGMMVDETLTSPNGYGLWDLDNFSPLLIALKRNTAFDPYAYAGNLFHNEGIYRTYVLSFWEQDSDIHSFYSKAGYVGAGHGEGHAIVYYNNADVLQLAHAYNDSVLAWHYYANPSPCRRGNFDDFLGDWNTVPPPIGWQDWRLFLYWNDVHPVSPAQAGWPLSRLFEGAGAAVMRKSWDKHQGLVWFRAGYGGSHYQPCQGTVIYHSNDTVILGNGGTQGYSSDSRMNNVLLVDGAGQVSPYPSLPDQRKSYGTMQRINDDTYRARLDSAYLSLSAGVSWTRRVHYERINDILEINDSVSTSDGMQHQLAFNWVTDATVLTPGKIQLPGGYLMLMRSTSTLSRATPVVQPGAVDEAFQTLLVSAQGQSLNVNWYIGRDEAALESYINRASAIAPSNSSPATFALMQNWPNPCNPSSNISYSVAGSTAHGDSERGGRGDWVRLTVHDLLGREVAVLVNGYQAPGEHRVVFDGSKLASGVYVYRLMAGGQAMSRKLVLLK